MAVIDSYRAANTTISLRVQRQMAALWKNIDWNNLDDWIKANFALIVTAIKRGQLDSAALALPYLQRAALEAGVSLPQAASIDAAAMVASNYKSQDVGKLLQGAVILTKYRIGQGYSREDALLSGGQRLLGLTDMLVRDAGREAVSINMSLNEGIVGYRREASGATCGRCLILIGKFFKTNDGFERHPQCDCVHVPIYDDGNGGQIYAGEGQTGDDIFNDLTPAQQNAALGKDAALVRSGKVSLQDAVNTRLRNPDKLDRLHRATSAKGLRQKYGDDPTKLAKELGRRGLLA